SEIFAGPGYNLIPNSKTGGGRRAWCIQDMDFIFSSFKLEILQDIAFRTECHCAYAGRCFFQMLRLNGRNKFLEVFNKSTFRKGSVPLGKSHLPVLLG